MTKEYKALCAEAIDYITDQYEPSGALAFTFIFYEGQTRLTVCKERNREILIFDIGKETPTSLDSDLDARAFEELTGEE